MSDGGGVLSENTREWSFETGQKGAGEGAKALVLTWRWFVRSREKWVNGMKGRK